MSGMKTRKKITCIGEVRGQENSKIGLLIAACGRHNALLIGPPGEGKSFLISTIEGFLPQQTEKERKELDEICVKNYNANSDININQSVMYGNNSIGTTIRPVIQVAPTITETGLLGGGRKPMPGSVSHAHSGILFMDEFPEYDRSLLESLRGVMEDGDITIARGGEVKTFLADFQLLCAMNPCPCGYLGTSQCECTHNQIHRYQGKLSGPILDRLDMILRVGRITAKQKFSSPIKGQTYAFKCKVNAATQHRLNTRDQIYTNKHIPGHKVFVSDSPIFNWTDNALKQFMIIIDSPMYSTRKAIRLARVSRTVADILLKEEIDSSHLDIAKGYVNNKLLE